MTGSSKLEKSVLKFNLNLVLFMKSKLSSKYLPLAEVACAGIFLFPVLGAQAQNMYVSDWDFPGVIHEYAPGSQNSTTFYSGGLGEPGGIAFNSMGTLFVGNVYNGVIDEISPGGTLTTFASGLNNPNGLAFDGAGDLFVTDYNANTIYEFASHNGSLSSTPTVFSGISSPTDLAFDSTGDLFVSSASSGKIYKFQNNGGTLSSSSTVYASGFVLPFGLAFNGGGDLFVSYDGLNITPTSGGVTEIRSGGSEQSIASGLYDPNDIAFNNAGVLFITDAESGNITEVAPGGATSSFFVNYHPYGIAFQDVTLPVPEPSSLALFGVGAFVMLWRGRHIWQRQG